MNAKNAVTIITGTWSVLTSCAILGILICGLEWQRSVYVGRGVEGLGMVHPTVVIGLDRVVITLAGARGAGQQNDTMFSKHFSWNEGLMREHFRRSLSTGYPHHAITILEYLKEEFGWTPRLALAGRLAELFLRFSLSAGIFTSIIASLRITSLLVPGVAATGVFLLATSACYGLVLPEREPLITVSGGWLVFHYGSAYRTTAMLGLASLVTSCAAWASLRIHHELPLLDELVSKALQKVSRYMSSIKRVNNGTGSE